MGNKKSSGYSKKRKYYGSQFQSSESTAKKPKVSDQGEKSNANTSASARKISARISTEHKESIKKCVSGFRLFDMEILKDIFELLPCSNCQKCCLEFLEDNDNRMGCASYFNLRCSSCKWEKKLYTSKQNKNFYEVNRRMVYAMRSIGCGHAGAKRFCGLMNMPPPPRPTPYFLHSKALLKSADCV